MGSPTDSPLTPEQALAENETLRQRVAELERRLARFQSRGAPNEVEGELGRTLSEREALLAEAERIVHMGSWVWDTTTNAVLWSDELYRILGYDPAVDSASTEAFFARVHPDDRERVRAMSERNVKSGLSGRTYFRVLRPDGVEREVWMDGAMLFDDHGLRRVVGTLVDVTERNRLEAELQRAQKMEAIGRLAGGIAHDFNNALTIILANAEILRRQGPSARLDDLVAAAEGATSLSRQLLAFGRRAVLAPTPVAINQAVATACSMLRRVIPDVVELSLDLAPDAWTVLVDPGQLQQAIVNLTLNARDAMPDGGALVVRTENVVADEARRADNPLLAPGDYVRISFEDTGVGVDEAALPHLFEPFFTTKDEGKGTGLGLAMVFGFVSQAGGVVRVEPNRPKGTRVYIELPRSRAAADAPAPTPAPVTSE